MNTSVQFLQKRLQVVAQERDAYVDVAKALEGLLDETSSSACGFAFDVGIGNEPLTQAQAAEVISTRYPGNVA